jgi:hypothetical protein
LCYFNTTNNKNKGKTVLLLSQNKKHIKLREFTEEVKDAYRKIPKLQTPKLRRKRRVIVRDPKTRPRDPTHRKPAAYL